MSTLQELKIELENAQIKLDEAKKQYAAFIAPGSRPRPIPMKEIRPVHNRLAKARELVSELQRELRRAMEKTE